jgi:hypothetical protein
VVDQREDAVERGVPGLRRHPLVYARSADPRAMVATVVIPPSRPIAWCRCCP